MKIMQVNCVYKQGSTGKIVYDIHHELIRLGQESIVAYGRGPKVCEKNIYKISSEIEAKVHSVLTRLFSVQFGYSPVATSRIIRLICREKPDVVHLHCLNGHFVNVYKLVRFLKENRIPTVLTLHAEIMHTAGCAHAMECIKWKTKCSNCHQLEGYLSHYFRDDASYCFRRMKDAFYGFDNLIVASVSQWLKIRAQQSPIFRRSNHAAVMNGLDTSICHRYDCEMLKKQYAPNDEKIIFHATPSFNLDPNHIKGGYYVNELAKRFAGEKVKFVIAGPHTDNIAVPDNVVLLGNITDQKELAQFYSMADLTILTSKKETFSMVTAESLCCGTPVLGFESGAPETIAIKEYSEFVSYGNINKLEKAARMILRKAVDRDKISSEACNLYSKENMVREYCTLYNKAVKL